MPTDALYNCCEHCGCDFKKTLKPIAITTDNISRLRKEDPFMSSLSVSEFDFIIAVLKDLNKSYMYRLFYECGKSYFGVKYFFDSTFVRFYFAKKDGKFIYKYRKASFNSREEIELDNLDKKEFDKVMQCSRISLTYRYSYEHDKKIKSLE